LALPVDKRKFLIKRSLLILFPFFMTLGNKI